MRLLRAGPKGTYTIHWLTDLAGAANRDRRLYGREEVDKIVAFDKQRGLWNLAGDSTRPARAPTVWRRASFAV
jgi:hypothetical protein